MLSGKKRDRKLVFVQPRDRFHSKSDGNGAANKYTIVKSAVCGGRAAGDWSGVSSKKFPSAIEIRGKSRYMVMSVRGDWLG